MNQICQKLPKKKKQLKKNCKAIVEGGLKLSSLENGTLTYKWKCLLVPLIDTKARYIFVKQFGLLFLIFYMSKTSKF
jgi:hypothetical protein